MTFSISSSAFLDTIPSSFHNDSMLSITKHPQWPLILEIHLKLQGAGYRVLVAGGAVRDAILGRRPSDIDVATNATPEQVAKLFEKTIMVGKQFGVCRVVFGDQVIEVASFRKDGLYVDGRRPESVEFSTPEEDAARRDFTINALFMDIVTKEVIDYVGGREDLKRRVIKTVGDPEKRFAEDKLRVLRAVRFMAQLNFQLDLKTEKAIVHFDLKQVSQERIRDEWEKLLLAPHRLIGMEMAKKCKIWRQLFPDWSYSPAVYGKIFGERKFAADRLWSLWFLLHWKSDSEVIQSKMEAWKLPKALVQRTAWTAKNWARLGRIEELDPVDTALLMSERFAIEALELYRICQSPGEKWQEAIVQARSFYKEGGLPKALVNGDDLIRLGVKPGQGMADQIRRLYRLQLKEGLSSKGEVLSRLS